MSATWGKRLSHHLSSLLAVLMLGCATHSMAATPTYSFAVLPQRSPMLTARYWNPLLEYVSRKSGVTLQLVTERTPERMDGQIAKSQYDFIYTNHHFQPALLHSGYHVILRPDGEVIRSVIVTLAESPVHSLEDLNGKPMGFPAPSSFVGYWVPLDYLRHQRLTITPVFGGNQEGIMGQLKTGRVQAIAANDGVMREFAKREAIKYRVLWSSAAFLDIPISAHGRLPADIIRKVSAAFVSMQHDPAGKKLLADSARLVGDTSTNGFVTADDAAYQNQVAIYRHTMSHSGN